MNIKKPALGMKEPTVEQPTNTDTKRPKNPSASTIPSEGYVLEIDGKLEIGIRDFGSGDEISLGAQEKVSTNPDQCVRRKRACANAGRANR